MKHIFLIMLLFSFTIINCKTGNGPNNNSNKLIWKIKNDQFFSDTKPYIDNENVVFWGQPEKNNLSISIVKKESGEYIKNIYGYNFLNHGNISKENENLLFPSTDYVMGFSTENLHVLWNYHYNGQSLGFQLATCNNMVFTGYNESGQEFRSKYLALNINDGSVIWEKTYWDRPNSFHIYNNKLYVATMSAYIGGESGYDFRGGIYCIDPITGDSLWHYRAPKWSPTVQDTTIAYQSGGIICGLGFVGNEIAAATFNGWFLIVNTETGKETWRMAQDYYVKSGVITEGSLAYYGDSWGFVKCVDIKNKKLIWESETPAGIQNYPHIYGNRIYVLNNGGIRGLNKNTGEIEFEYTVEDEDLFGAPTIEDGRLYFMGENNFYCVQIDE